MIDGQDLERRLQHERPLPNPAFRGDLRRRLSRSETTRHGRARIRILCLAYACSGIVLLITAAAGVAGIGPLSAG